MVMTDPIADMLTIIRNGLMARKESVQCPYSHIKEGILGVLKAEGYINDFKKLEISAADEKLKIYLKYGPKGEKIITKLIRVSKPGRRMYSKIKELPTVLNGLGVNILSTSNGVVSDRQARSDNIGGEVLCRVW